jgi:hypothetical protein
MDQCQPYSFQDAQPSKLDIISAPPSFSLESLEGALEVSLVSDEDQMAPFEGQPLAHVSTTGHPF